MSVRRERTVAILTCKPHTRNQCVLRFQKYNNNACSPWMGLAFVCKKKKTEMRICRMLRSEPVLGVLLQHGEGVRQTSTGLD